MLDPMCLEGNPYVGSHVFGKLMDKPAEGKENERLSDKGCFFRVYILDFLSMLVWLVKFSKTDSFGKYSYS